MVETLLWKKKEMSRELDTSPLLPSKEKNGSKKLWEYYYIMQGKFNPLYWYYC